VLAAAPLVALGREPSRKSIRHPAAANSFLLTCPAYCANPVSHGYPFFAFRLRRLLDEFLKVTCLPSRPGLELAGSGVPPNFGATAWFWLRLGGGLRRWTFEQRLGFWAERTIAIGRRGPQAVVTSFGADRLRTNDHRRTREISARFDPRRAEFPNRFPPLYPRRTVFCARMRRGVCPALVRSGVRAD